jgi:hypothetical protein
MNIPNIYEGLKVEPANVSTIETIPLRAKVLDPNHFVFIPEYWEASLKPFKKANWKHDSFIYSGGVKVKNLHNYTLKQGNYIVFPKIQVLDGGFYIARLYMVISTMEQGEQAHGEFTKSELVIRQNNQTVTLKTNPLGSVDNIYHAHLGLP